jgi:hypothetical protein
MNSSWIRIDPHPEESIREIEYAVKEKSPFRQVEASSVLIMITHFHSL